MGGARKINAIVVGICMEIYSKNGTRSAVMKIMVPIQMKTKKTMHKLRFIFLRKKNSSPFETTSNVRFSSLQLTGHASIKTSFWIFIAPCAVYINHHRCIH